MAKRTRRTSRKLRGGVEHTKLRVRVYEMAGTPEEREFETESMSGQELESLEEAIKGLSAVSSLGDVEVSTDDAVTLERSDGFPEDWIAKNANKRITIKPRRFGASAWKTPVEVEFKTSEGGRKKRRGKRVTRKTRRV